MTLSEIVQRGWEAVGAWDFDTLISDYSEEMVFIMPGQSDILEGRMPFREALNKLGSLLPAGFEITGLRHLEGAGEVLSVVEWKSDKVSSSQLTVLFKFSGDKIYEERWFIDTNQWQNAM